METLSHLHPQQRKVLRFMEFMTESCKRNFLGIFLKLRSNFMNFLNRVSYNLIFDGEVENN